MASSGNNPFDTLAGTRNNTLTQTTVSASGRDTDHIHSSRERFRRPSHHVSRIMQYLHADCILQHRRYRVV